MAKLIIHGLFTLFSVSASVVAQNDDIRPRLVHYERFEVKPEPKTFLEVTEAQRVAWERLVEQCTPIQITQPLSVSCLLLAEQYFSEEPVWPYSRMFYYDERNGWVPVFERGLSNRQFSIADYLNKDVPLWSDIFDGQLEQRKEHFLQIVADSSCLHLANPNTLGMHPTKQESCAARELYKYATYLDACFDAEQRLYFFQESFGEESPYGDSNMFELSFQSLDVWVPDTTLRSSAKRRIEKGILHAYWVAKQCRSYGYVLFPGVSLGEYTTSNELMLWEDNPKKYFWFLSHTYEKLLRIATKSGDNWAIRTNNLGRYLSDEFNEDLIKKYPLLMHRRLGKGVGYRFTWVEKARHRAKAYLLLVEQAGEEIAHIEYDPKKLKNEIEYVKNGGTLRFPPSRAELLKEGSKRLREREEDERLKEVQGELF